jgi:hypothetical protein
MYGHEVLGTEQTRDEVRIRVRIGADPDLV